MRVMLNPDAWNIDAHIAADGTRFEKGKPVTIDAKTFDALKGLTVNHFGAELPLLVEVKADAAEAVSGS